jgi:predicted N-acetyltransferase YhbS
VIIRREIAEDVDSAEAVTSAAFAVGDGVQELAETRLLRLLRADSGWIPTLSMVAVDAPDPEWGAHFQVRLLTDCPPSLTGPFRYAAPFASL